MSMTGCALRLKCALSHVMEARKTLSAVFQRRRCPFRKTEDLETKKMGGREPDRTDSIIAVL
jgi:hypothetical protein